MSSIKNVVQGIRSNLLYPDYKKVPNHLILDRLQDRFAYYLTALNIVNENWFLTRYPLTVTPNTDEFPIDIPIGSKPVLCVTVDNADPFHVEREVEILTVQNRDLYYIGPKQGLSSATFPHVATSIAFFYDQDNGQRIAKVTPQHTMVATYMIWLQPDVFAPPRLADNFPLLENFLNLTKTDVALSLTPALLEEDGSNAIKVGKIESRLQADFNRFDSQFTVYKQMAFNEQAGTRRGWATDSSGDYTGW